MSDQENKVQVIESSKILDNRWDQVLANGVTKTALGFAGGVVLSVLLKRKPGFVFLGTGFGLGMAYAEGDAVFRSKAGLRSVNL